MCIWQDGVLVNLRSRQPADNPTVREPVRILLMQVGHESAFSQS